MNAVKHAAADMPLAGRRAPAARVPVLFTLAVGILLFLAVGLFHIWSRVAIVEQGYAIGRQRSLREELLQERKSLQLELARLREPVRLERAAVNLGLAAPTPGQIVIMGEHR
jgi:cell division protein FtsL